MLPSVNLALQSAMQQHQSGRLAEAEQAYRNILSVDPENASAMQLLGVVALQSGRAREAAELISRAIQIHGGEADWYVNLGAAFNALQLPQQARDAFGAAITLNPSNAVAYANLSAVLKDFDVEESIAIGRRAIELRPDPIAHSNLLLSLNYRLTDPQQVLQEHRAWAERYARPLHESVDQTYANPRDPEKRLRIGYISADFREHAMAHFLLPLLAAHDQERFDIVCFDDTLKSDSVSSQFRQLACRWIPTARRPPDQIARMVRDEKVDILIDVTGHFAGNRLLVFARRPAPVQVTCIGYPCTTGLTEIDYRISDAICDPPGAETQSAEKLLRLPEIFWCYQPPANCPDVISLPAAENGGTITFGSANVYAKVTATMLDLWGQILARVPKSRLVLQGIAYSLDIPRQTVLAALARHGVDAARVQFIAREPLAQHLQTLSRFDIALDTAPFNGGTTTCHALWMSAPVVSLAGNRHASRMGASILSNVGLDAWVAQSGDEYIERAVTLANDAAQLTSLRQSMRDRLSSSPLMRAAPFAAGFEQALRAAWRAWCG
jgi:predicted O-linked N-acetylglucosamine transferase (SPINDLY family)